MIRNIIKYTIGLPLILLSTPILGLYIFMDWMMGGDGEAFRVALADLWRPL